MKKIEYVSAIGCCVSVLVLGAGLFCGFFWLACIGFIGALVTAMIL